MFNYTYRNDIRILAGDGALGHLPFELRELSASRPLILTDEIGANLGALKKVESSLNGAIQPAYVFTKVFSTADGEQCEKIAALYRKNDCDSIVVVGRENSITTAKVIKLMILDEVSNIQSLKANRRASYQNKSVPLIIIPNDLATGLEGCSKIDIADKRSNEIFRLETALMHTDTIIFDETLLDVTPPITIAKRTLYALSMACEGLIREKGNAVMEGYCLSAVKIIKHYFKKAIRKNANRGYTIRLSTGIAVAGLAYSDMTSDLYLSIVRAISVGCNVDKYAVAYIIFFNYFEQQLENLGQELRQEILNELYLDLAGEEKYALTAKAAREQMGIAEIKDYFTQAFELTEIPCNLADLGIERDMLTNIAERVCHEYKSAKHSEVLAIISKALGEKTEVIKKNKKKEKKAK